MHEMQHKMKLLAKRIGGDETSLSKVPVLNHIIMGYLGISVVCFALFLIAPFVTIVANTPFYSMKAYLGVFGAVLLLIDIFTNRGLWRGNYCLLLFAVCAVAGISSLMTVSYGVKDNLFLLCWTGLQFSLFYSCASRIDEKTLKRYLMASFFTLLGVWLIACGISLLQYVFQIGYHYISDPNSADQSTVRQGFLENRLFGVFSPLNHAAHVSVALVIGGIYYFKKIKNVPVRVLLVVSQIVFFLHVLLSGSRSGMLALLVAAFVLSWICLHNALKLKTAAKFVTETALAVCITLACIPCIELVKTGAGHIPQLAQDCNQEDYTIIQQDYQREALPAAIQEDILDRDDVKGDVSNGRLMIWKDYASIYKDFGLFGKSPGNYMAVVRDTHPELEIVRYFKEIYPEKYAAGNIYHVHSGYLMLFTSTGFLGVLLMAAFVVLCIRRVVLYIRKHDKIGVEFMVPIALVAAGALAAVFDKGIFFTDNAQTFIFWIALGLVMAQTRKSDENTEVSR